MWTETVLQKVIHEQLGDRRLVVVSNREPYLHRYENASLMCERPASGMASALDPVLRACGGVWVAHGSGAADSLVVDASDRVLVPPEDPYYTLRRVWLTKEEEAGYYYGVANDALWPLCHLVFARPRFSLADWNTYVKVNEKFAHAVLEEIAGAPAIVWVQDYHLALLPCLLKKRRPDVVVAQFWHIPWPNPEVFQICPWRRELLEGLLANDLLGFHIRSHCDNFLSTVERELEVRIDRERSSVFHHNGIKTLVRPFPISTDFAALSQQVNDEAVSTAAQQLKTTLQLQGRRVCISLDRFDYTKGIPERLLAIDRFFEKYPEHRGHMVFLQTGPESRGRLARYKELNVEIDQLVEKINKRYGDQTWLPVLLLRRHFPLTEVLALYRLAEVCVVSSLHDGMNLVAKEYIAAKTDEAGVLVLSSFTGAAQELHQSVLMNPYDTEGFADALHAAFTMDHTERATRMRALRATVENNNIYRWAGKILHTLALLPNERYLPAITVDYDGGLQVRKKREAERALLYEQ